MICVGLRCGINLVLTARSTTVLQQLATEVAARHRVETRVVTVDFELPTAIEELLEATANLEIGLLIAAAGFGTSGLFLNSSPERELAMLDVNCRAVLLLAHHFGRRFAKQKRGGIVLMGSIVGFQGVPNAAHYAATKAYIQTLAEALHVELAPLGVDVLASAPGPVHTGFAARAGNANGRCSATD